MNKPNCCEKCRTSPNIIPGVKAELERLGPYGCWLDNCTCHTAPTKKDYAAGIAAQNKYGEWVPLIPEPFWRGFGLTKAQCMTCTEQPVFPNREVYRGHYALAHILGL